jgi:hypothetical protein
MDNYRCFCEFKNQERFSYGRPTADKGHPV